LESLNKILKWKYVEVDILNGDLERGGRYLQELLESNNSKTSLGNIYMYLGIYHFKRNEKEKALDYFNKASDLVKTPYSVERIQYYKSRLI
jgi:tetratricopeptide (TPR) repeat protein